MAEFLSLPDAIAEHVHDGETVALEGFTHLIPFAAGHEIIRQGRRDLTLIRMTPDLIYDQLIGMGCARKLVFSWGGNPGVGSLHRLRDAVEHGWPRPLELEEHSHAAMASAYAAGAAGLPCAILRGYMGSDLVGKQPEHPRRHCPFTGERLAAVPALRPDVAIIHAQRADRAGQRADRGHHRRAEGGRAGGATARSSRWRRSWTTCGRPARTRSCCRTGRSTRDRRGAGRRAPLLRPRLLRARQRLLHRLGRHRARPRDVSGLDAGACPEAAALSETQGHD